MANEGRSNLQDEFLNRIRKSRTPVTIHVINGYQLNHLKILSYDSYVISAVDDRGAQKLIYKHAISTLTPEAGENTSDSKENNANDK